MLNKVDLGAKLKKSDLKNCWMRNWDTNWGKHSVLPVTQACLSLWSLKAGVTPAEVKSSGR